MSRNQNPSREDSHHSYASLNWGRSFVHPVFDYLFIGGGLSLLTVVTLWQWSGRQSLGELIGDRIFPLILLCNSAHFAASTIRLYSKPGAVRQWPFLTCFFPLLGLALTLFLIAFAQRFALHFYSLYLTWSPYHYAAQAYGLSMMYGYRSGATLTSAQRSFFYWSCLTGFFLALVSAEDNRAGIWWFVPWVWINDYPMFGEILEWSRTVLAMLAISLPVIGFFWVQLKNATPLPLISLLIPVTNALWFAVFPFMGAFGLATVFHGLQYLAIVVIFHVAERRAMPNNRHGWFFHSIVFYLGCLVFGYALFQCWPYGLVAIFGLDYAMSVFVTVAAINIHHFIVDAYIWKLRNDPNYKLVEGQAEV